MLALANVVHFLPDELAGLRRGRLALGRVLAGALSRLLLRHSILLRSVMLPIGPSCCPRLFRKATAVPPTAQAKVLFRIRLRIWRARDDARDLEAREVATKAFVKRTDARWWRA